MNCETLSISKVFKRHQNKDYSKVEIYQPLRLSNYCINLVKKTLQSQKKFDAQLENAQLSAGQQIDKQFDQNLDGFDAKVKSIIKETVKSQSIKREAIEFDQSRLECELTSKSKETSSTVVELRKPHPAHRLTRMILILLKPERRSQGEVMGGLNLNLQYE